MKKIGFVFLSVLLGMSSSVLAKGGGPKYDKVSKDAQRAASEEEEKRVHRDAHRERLFIVNVEEEGKEED